MNCLLLVSTWIHSRLFDGLPIFFFFCVVLSFFVFVLCVVPNVAGVSILSILDFSFRHVGGFLRILRKLKYCWKWSKTPLYKQTNKPFGFRYRFIHWCYLHVRVFNNNTTGVTSGTGSGYPSGVHEFTSCFFMGLELLNT